MRRSDLRPELASLQSSQRLRELIALGRVPEDILRRHDPVENENALPIPTAYGPKLPPTPTAQLRPAVRGRGRGGKGGQSRGGRSSSL
eukprot:4272957-Pyramimonas_sp.AAC.1